MVQELIPGRGDMQYSYAAFIADGEPCASLVARRLRQYPLEFGRSSSYVETIHEPAIEESAQYLLSAQKFTGLVEVEFKRDSRDGEFKLLDVNPRVWGWHSIGRRAGVDFPYLLWQHYQGCALARARGAPGIRWVRAITDIQAVLREVSRHELSVGSYIRSLSGPLECAIFAIDDPLPAFVEAPLLAHLAFKRGAT
jgi:predicted ATP-grasp superfamily ATP-dependent carboligase